MIVKEFLEKLKRNNYKVGKIIVISYDEEGNWTGHYLKEKEYNKKVIKTQIASNYKRQDPNITNFFIWLEKELKR